MNIGKIICVLIVVTISMILIVDMEHSILLLIVFILVGVLIPIAYTEGYNDRKKGKR